MEIWKIKKYSVCIYLLIRLFLDSEVSIESEFLIFLISHDTSFLVFTDSLLEEIGLALEGDHVHPVEGVLGVVHFLVAEGIDEPVSNEFDVLLHELRGKREKISQEN